ncbi:MAG: GntR family transcriptional regulator [Deltaproteobacteria bacterium]|jgi:GntR family transcriptional regulator of arabinose operon|nr:GntR family transcriptional regulator [Deltaproteobacteria bacterium]
MFKYMEIVEWVKDQITGRGLAPGDRFDSEHELCRELGASRQTVRQALEVLRRDGVVSSRRGSGTFVTKNDFSGRGGGRARGKTVGVISTYFSDYIFPHIVSGVERVLTENEVTMRLAVTNNMVSEEARALRSMLDQNVAGLIVEPSKSALPNPNVGLYDEVRRREIPLVFFNAAYPWSSFPRVAMDDVAAGRLATEHLLSLGHEKIAGIFLLDDLQGHDRYKGFLESQGDGGQAENRVLWFSNREKATLFSLSAERVAALIDSCSAAVCYNDAIALGLYEFCRGRGMGVPDDLSVIGIDDSRLATICAVPLTSVRHPHQKLGERVAEELLAALGSSSAGKDGYLFEPTLVERASTGPPAALGGRSGQLAGQLASQLAR